MDGEAGNKQRSNHGSLLGSKKPPPGLKPKDLVGIPWMVAFALRADGWWLRQDIIWHKPNPMPESCNDRCTKSHEHIFLMSKSAKYYYDHEAIKENCDWDGKSGAKNYDWENDGRSHNPDQRAQTTRNIRDVWTVSVHPYKGAHFATFPPKLIEPCVEAGCPREVCSKCGEPRHRITESNQIKRKRKTPTTMPCDDRSPSANDVAGISVETVGWTDCGCGAGFQAGIVLDPYMGAGTAALVAAGFGRRYIGIELNPEYAEKARERVHGPLFTIGDK